MPELENLGFAVQEKVAAPDFDEILRRGRRRRSRDRALMIAAAAATAVVVAALAVTPITLSRGPDGQNPASPGPTAEAKLQAFVMTAPDQWVATWEDCTPPPCKHIAKVRRGDTEASTTAEVEIRALRSVDPASSHSAAEPFAVVGAPPMMRVFRLTPDGPVSRQLEYAGDTSSFGPDDVLTDDVSNQDLLVVNLRAMTVRNLPLPDDLAGGRAPVRDNTGRWWIQSGTMLGYPRAWLAWTDDGGRNWSRHQLVAGDPIDRLAVSPDGRTAVATVKNSVTATRVEDVWMSRDRGRTWTAVKNPPWDVDGGPVVFDDGTAVLIGRDRNDHGQSGFRVNRNGTTTKIDVFPSYTSLGQAGELIYATMEDTVSVSTDRGLVWTEITP